MSKTSMWQSVVRVSVGMAALTLACVGPAAASSWAIAVGTGSSGEVQSSSLPAAPGGPAAACVSSSSNTIKVTWSAVTDASSYTVYEATSASTGPYSAAATGITSTSWTSGSLSSGNYWFEVSAYEGTNWQSTDSAATAESTVTSSPSKTCRQP